MARDPATPPPSLEEQEEYERRLLEARHTEERVPLPLLDGKKVVWKALAGSQNSFLQCPFFEVLFHGNRGPGKTDGLIWCYGQDVGKFGAAWAGVIFRQTYPQLADVQAKTEKWFRQTFGGHAKFNRAKMLWEWDSGERLLLRHLARPEDYWNYHGHEYPFLGFEELCNWSTPDCYTSMFACCRSSTEGVPKIVRATTNPYGPGHNWVKDRFQLAGQWWNTITQLRPVNAEGKVERERCAIHGDVRENTILLKADPDYQTTVTSSSFNKAMLEAWLTGSWDIVAGGMFGDVWDPQYNIVKPFQIPHTWRIDRAFDWGSSRPFSVGWYAESDGSDYIDGNGKVRSSVRGDVFRINEWYGWSGRPNEGKQMLAVDVAKGIVERELLWKLNGKVRPGPADSSIYDVENGMSIGNDMEKPVRIGNLMYKGVVWTKADKRPGSRKSGWELMRNMMKQAHPNQGRPRERPGLFVFENCTQFMRTVPTLPRDEKDMDDIDTDAEDHIGDETRYRLRSSGARSGSGRQIGLF